MSIFIGYDSSYEYWRANDMPSVSAAPRMAPHLGLGPQRKELAQLDLDALGIRAPVHFIVADARDRVRPVGFACHVQSDPFPRGSFVKLAEGLYGSSPERSFLEMAQSLPLVELVRFGFVLCSAYAYDDSDRGFRGHPPLATVQSLARYLEKSRGRRGVKQATRALRYIANLSASPMETMLVMSLCLPRMVGGYGLVLPELNARVEARVKGLVERDHFECDLLWRKQRVAVEYDSGAHHSGDRAETRDSARRSALLAHGIIAVSITPEQFFDARKFDEAARAIAKLVGQRLPADDASWMMRRYRLRNELLVDLSYNRRPRGARP